MSSPLKILIGTTEIAGAFADYRSGYEACGCIVTTLVRQRVKRFEHLAYDYVLEDMLPDFSVTPLQFIRNKLLFILRHLLLFYLLLRTDVFHVIWPGDFVKWRFFLPVIRFFRPGLIILFNPVGDDIRWRQAFIQEGEQIGFKISDAFKDRAASETTTTLEEKLTTLRTFEQFADLICSHPSQAQIELRPYRYYYLPMQLDHITYNDTTNAKPIIVHAATERAVKGTRLVEETVRKLRSAGYDFEFRLLENMPNAELLKVLTQADVVVYNPYGRGTGKFGLEAMASGCLLFTAYDLQYLPVPPNPPVVNVNPDNLFANLERFLQNPQEMRPLKKRGRQWVEDYFSAPKVCGRLLADIEKIRRGDEPAYDFYPEFFRNTYTPVLGTAETELHNRYLEPIRSSSWYKKHVKPGGRAEIRF